MSNNYEVISKEPVAGAEVLAVISKKAKDTELTYREEKTQEYLKNFSKLSLKDFEKAKAELIALELPRIEDEQIVKILELMPSNGTELRAIVSHSGVVLVDENVTKTLDVLNSYRK